MTDQNFTVLCPFGGSGGGALGFLGAEVRLLGVTSRFRCLGSIDFDALACEDFERFTGSPALCANVETLTAEDVRAFAGPPPAARAVAERMLVALTEASLGAMSLSSSLVWVEPHRGEEVSWNW